MRTRSDPLVPLLGSAVFVIVVLAAGLVFYPRLVDWFDRRDRVVAQLPAPDLPVPVWVCRSEEGVALILQPAVELGLGDALEEGLEGDVDHFLRLEVFNFARAESFVLDLPAAGFATPEGGTAARPAAALLRAEIDPKLRTILQGLGAVSRLEVAPGHRGQALLAVAGDPARRTAFVAGALRFERREVARWTLAAWRHRPSLEGFLDF